MKTLLICLILVVSVCQFGHSQTPADIQILHATYGADSTQMDVTQKVQAAVANGQRNFRADNSFFGKDPAFGKVKTLSAIFLQGGTQHQTVVREGEQFSFALPNAQQMNVAPQTQATKTDHTPKKKETNK
jgi:hypothetical protein